MKKPFFIRSVYLRTILQLTLTIVATFSVLGLVYYHAFSISTTRQQAGQLLSGARAISEVVAGRFNASGEITDPSLNHYINFAARSSGAVVWVINQSGELVMHTGIPGDAATMMDVSANGYYQLDQTYLVAMGAGTGGTSQVGDFQGLFKASGLRWISAAYPLPTPLGGYRGEIQIHFPVQGNDIGTFLMANGLILSFIVAFAIGLLFVGILSHNITRPIRLLSETADKVSRGDLSARVEIPGLHEIQGGGRAFGHDDLTVLMSTINTMLDKLENQEKDRKEFISNISHDLRTPLTSIYGFVEGMLDGTVPIDKYPYYLEIVRKETGRLQSLVSTMFETVLLESGQQLNPTVFDINELLKEDVIGLESLLAEKNLGVQTDFAEDEYGRLQVKGDRDTISRVVYNILSNAIRFAPQDGVIALTTRRSALQKEIEIMIEDNGPGIPEQEQPYVFDRFYKVDKSRTAKGSGLGLYICKTILAAHGQRISVSKSEMGGARFVFTLAAV